MEEKNELEKLLTNINRIISTVNDFKEMFDKIALETNAFASRKLKMYWNYSEKYCKNYSLEDAIKWVKENLPKDKKQYKACLFKDIDVKDDIFIIYHFYLLDNKPCLDGTLPYYIVFAKDLSDNLINQFGEKSLIIFK